MNPHDKQSETLPKAVTARWVQLASLERQYEELCRLRKAVDELTKAANRSKRS
jgi:hypothetical protein